MGADEAGATGDEDAHDAPTRARPAWPAGRGPGRPGPPASRAGARARRRPAGHEDQPDPLDLAPGHLGHVGQQDGTGGRPGDAQDGAAPAPHPGQPGGHRRPRCQRQRPGVAGHGEVEPGPVAGDAGPVRRLRRRQPRRPPEPGGGGQRQRDGGPEDDLAAAAAIRGRTRRQIASRQPGDGQSDGRDQRQPVGEEQAHAHRAARGQCPAGRSPPPGHRASATAVAGDAGEQRVHRRAGPHRRGQQHQRRCRPPGGPSPATSRTAASAAAAAPPQAARATSASQPAPPSPIRSRPHASTTGPGGCPCTWTGHRPRSPT